MSYENPTVITLGSLQYITDGVVIAQPVSEWAEGIKQGEASYADIDHAFYYQYNDFRGGAGTRFGVAKEIIDKFNYSSHGVKTWENRGGIQMAPALTTGSLSGISCSFLYRSFPMLEHHVDANSRNYLWMATPSKILRFDDSGNTWVDDSPSAILATGNIAYSLYEWTNQANSHYLFASVGSLTSGAKLSPADQKLFKRDASITVGSAAAWSQDANEFAHDFLEFDRTLFLIYYGTVKASTDGTTWTTVLTIPSYPYRRGMVMSKFVGIAQDAGGSYSPYVIHGKNLYVIDVYYQQYAKVDTGCAFGLVDGVIWGDEVVVTDTYSVKLIHPQRPVREIGLPSLKDGFNYNNGLRFLRLMPFGPYLIAYCEVIGPLHLPLLFLWNGSGWHFLAFPANYYTNQYEGFMMQGRNMGIYTGNSPLNKVLKLFFVSADTNDTPIIPNFFSQAEGIINQVNYIPSGNSSIVTPWFDGGFADMIGTIIEATCSSFNLSSGARTIIVEYQLDGDEINWTTLGTFSTSPQQTKAFPPSGATGIGVTFKTIRFRISPGVATGTTSPVLNALTIKYLKKPRARFRYTFNIDVDATAQMREGAGIEVSKQTIINELTNYVSYNPLIPFSYQGTTIRYVSLISLPRSDILSPEVADITTKIRVDLIEPVGV